jgi:plasmid stability protein
MKQALVRNIDDEVVAAYKTRAQLNGTSLEQELREVIVRSAPLTGAEIMRSIEEHQKRLEQSGFVVPVDFDIPAAIRWGRDDEFDA